MFPESLAGRPIEDALFVQLYTIETPVVELVKLTAVVEAPLHITWLATASTVAVGLTVMVKVIGVPVQVVEGVPALV